MRLMVRNIWPLALAAALTACSSGAAMSEAGTSPTAQPSPAARAADLPDLGPAPELMNSVWLNSGAPLRLADLRGKVVGVEMWTFGCINCQHVIPSLNSWYSAYRDQGFVLIGNHYPEFDYERDLAGLKQAVSQAGIQYPVAQDNEGTTWRAYHNGYWPTLYLIDKRGHIRYVHIGEGEYAQTEANIQSLLAEAYP
jgi:thiol-disulfide isomerase/thioredoxin